MLDVSVWEIFERIATEHPDREIVVTSSSRFTYGTIHDRAVAIGGFLHAHGIGCNVERDRLAGHESGQDHVGLLIGNRPEYLEAMFGAIRARAAPVNLNYRYTSTELIQLLNTAQVTALIYETDLAPIVAEALRALPPMKALIEVGGSVPVIDGAVCYESAATSKPLVLPAAPRPDDLIVACTGGTTGLPKAVLWRQGDLLAAMIGNPHTITNGPVETLDDLVAASRRTPLRVLMGPPLMHFSGFGTCLMLMTIGGVTLMAEPERGLDPVSFWQMIERERVQMATVVGDAFGRPLLKELRRTAYDTSSLRAILNGGAAMSDDVKRGLYDALGGRVAISDGVGSTEGGIQGRTQWKGKAQAAIYKPGPTTRLLSADRLSFLSPAEQEIGWLATCGRVPLGYLGEFERTAQTFPMVEGIRVSVPGDRARWRNDGTLNLLGRDSNTINSGGEKIFVEEVERALVSHDMILDAIVVGRPSTRWGQEVVALVVPVDANAFDPQKVLLHAATKIARYKLPKAMLPVADIMRTAVGKPDYVWAASIALNAARPVLSPKCRTTGEPTNV